MSFVLQLSGIFCGVLFRTFLPYLRKLKSGTASPFKGRYLTTAVSAAVIAFFTTFLVISNYSFSNTAVANAADGVRIFATAFAFGYAWNSLINEGVRWTAGGKAKH